jgi:site-specific DNA-methyltransferase (adenine-specific)
LTGATEPHFRRLIDTLRKCGLHFQKLWIWEKDVNGMGYSGRARHEGIAFFSKGQKRQPFDLSLPDVLSFPIVPPPQRCHPAEKPVALLKAIIQFATKAGELVLDCFAGSCATGRAALSLGRDSIMIEKSEEVLTRAVAS